MNWPTYTHCFLLFTLILALVPSHVDGSSSGNDASIAPTSTTREEIVLTLSGPRRVNGSAIAKHKVVREAKPQWNTFKGRTIPAKRRDSGLHRRLTNAQRLARGLGIASPQFQRMRERRETARRSIQSDGVKATAKGYLWCDYANGTALGWLLAEPAGRSSVIGRFSTSPTQFGFLELEFSFDPTPSPDTVREGIELKTPPTDPTDPSYAYYKYGFLGAVRGYSSSSDDLGTALYPYNYALLTYTISFGPGAPPTDGESFYATNVHDAPATLEGAIWTYRPSTKEIGAIWVNHNGDKIPVQIWHDVFDDLLLGTDPQAVDDQFGTKVDVLKCKFDDAFVPVV